MKRLAAILFLASVFALPVFSQDVSRQSERKKRLESEIAAIDAQLKELSGKKVSVARKAELIHKKLVNRREIIGGLDREIVSSRDSIVSKQKRINNLQKNLDTLEAYHGKLVYNLYRNRDTKVWFLYLLTSESIGQGYRRFSYFRNLSTTAAGQALAIKKSKARLEEEKSSLQQIKQRAEKVRGERQKEYDSLSAEENQVKKMGKEISRNEASFKKQLEAKKREIAALNREIEKILSGTVSKQKSEKTAVDVKLSARFGDNRGKLPWPVQGGVVTEQFGVHYHPVYKKLKLPENNGITITTAKNANVTSVFDGVVKQIVIMPGYNRCVLVQHGEYFTFYCKLDKTVVRAGQSVSAGEVLGSLAYDGNVSELHFQIWRGMEKQDPEKWLR